MHNMLYVPFRNNEYFSYSGKTEHILLLVEDKPGKVHFELKCSGPLTSRCFHDRIFGASDRPGLQVFTFDCSEQHLSELQEGMLAEWKSNRKWHMDNYEYALRHRGE